MDAVTAYRKIPAIVRICLASILLLGLVPLSSCSLFGGYYVTYSSRLKQLDFTFEYPRAWRVAIAEEYSDVAGVTIVDREIYENETHLSAMVYVYLNLDSPTLEWARDKADTAMSLELESQRNFQLIFQDTAILDGFAGYKIEYINDTIASDVPERVYTSVRHIKMFVPRNGKGYQISISASPNQWDKWETDIQHLLDSFRWK